MRIFNFNFGINKHIHERRCIICISSPQNDMTKGTLMEQTARKTILLIGATLAISAPISSYAAVLDDMGEANGICAKIELPCIATGNFAVVNPLAGDEALLDFIPQSQKRFTSHFTIEEIPSIVWRMTGERDASLDATKQNAEFEKVVILPWLSEAQKSALIRSQVEEQVRAQMAGQPEVVIQSILQQAYAQLPEGPDQDTPLTELEIGAIQHEFGHFWFIYKYEGALHAKEGKTIVQYGGAAPDWLDEVVAIMMENDTLEKGRLRYFAEKGKESLVPLERYFSMQHPLIEAVQEKLGAAAAATPENGQTSSVIIMGDNELPGTDGVDPALAFYTQGKLFSDFMIEKTGDKRVFEVISDEIYFTGDMAKWLKTQNTYSNLPRDLTALQLAWDAWASKQLAAAVSDQNKVL